MMDEDEFVYGEWVVYQPPYMEEPEIGRFVRYNDYGDAFICFHYGCTAASSPIEYVRHAMENEIIDAIEREHEYRGHIGYHRFDDVCDDYSPDACFGCIHDEEAT